MSEWWAYVGGMLLVAATLPQGARLLRERTARDLSWGFIAMNAAGIALLGARAAAIGEAAFVAVNAVTASFWTLALAVKARESYCATSARRRSAAASASSATSSSRSA